MKAKIYFNDNREPIEITNKGESFKEFIIELFKKPIYLSLSASPKLAINTKNILYVWEVEE